MEKHDPIQSSFGSGHSVVVKKCQTCSSGDLKSLLFLGYLPPVNKMWPIGHQPEEQPSYPAELLWCKRCDLVQLGLLVDPKILFPSEYPYTSSTTRVLRENFAELYRECCSLLDLKNEDLVVDIGSNDGNLLSNFKERHRVQGVTPEKIGELAVQRGIPTIFDYFSKTVVTKIRTEKGQARIVTATNVFAHMEEVHSIVEAILDLLTSDGVFISESHYLLPLIRDVQYDTVYHEHLRYYSLTSLKNLLETHGLKIFHARPIPSHGGSIRVYAARPGQYKENPSVQRILDEEKAELNLKKYEWFQNKVMLSKLQLMALLAKIKNDGQKIYGISAPSRASTLINYVGIDAMIVDCVLEIQGSHKIGKYVPGTLIPIVEENRLFDDPPDFALLFSWHISEELILKLKQRGFKGKFIVPLPEPRIVQ